MQSTAAPASQAGVVWCSLHQHHSTPALQAGVVWCSLHQHHSTPALQAGVVWCSLHQHHSTLALQAEVVCSAQLEESCLLRNRGLSSSIRCTANSHGNDVTMTEQVTWLSIMNNTHWHLLSYRRCILPPRVRITREIQINNACETVMTKTRYLRINVSVKIVQLQIKNLNGHMTRSWKKM